MKIRCHDGVVRRFRVAHTDGEYLREGRSQGSVEAACEECDAPFGIHDLVVLKPLFRAHYCSQPPIVAGLRLGGSAPPRELEAIADVVLAYRPKPRSKAAKKRARRQRAST
jgi:hypothetical protein